MVNLYSMRKWGGLVILGFLPTFAYHFGVLLSNNLLWGIGAFLIAFLICVFVAKAMLNNPFSAMLEGEGLLTMDLNSTGIIRLFIVGVKQPYISGKIQGESVLDVYDREAVFQLANPQLSGVAVMKDGRIKIELDEADFNKSRFGMLQYPVLIYNSQLKSLLTKDFLSEQEKDSFAEHGILYLNRKIEELTSTMRDFGRHVVEQLRPKANFMEGKGWIIWVLVIGVAILIFILVKPMLPQIMGAVNGAKAQIASDLPNNPVVPK